MKRVEAVFLFLLITLPVFAQGHADWANASPYSDVRSRQVGGILTVLIMEYSEASNEAGTNTNNDTKTNLQFNPAGALAKSLQGAGLDMPLKHESKGTGETMRRGKITGKLSVQITNIDESGNLVIEGNRIMDVNGDKQTMTLTGKIRPQDIRSDNTVYSYDIAGAELVVSGKGVLQNAARPGFLTKFFSWLL
ncbi:MAG: flagellar basal body L-ring protein FlgH [bacterium]|nr:flagellar basal body L-ring protein FlgH [bacterium]